VESGYHQPFSITKRKDSPFLGVQFWDTKSQKYMPARSTKEIDERKARIVASRWLQEYGGPPPKSSSIKTESNKELLNLLKRYFYSEGVFKAGEKITVENLLQQVFSRLQTGEGIKANPVFCDFLLSFWDWDTSSYIRDKLESGQTIGKQYAKANKGFISRYAVPFFGQTRIKSVTTFRLEEFKASLPRQDINGLKGLSPRSINAILGCIGTALEEAKRLGLIESNPASRMRKLAMGDDRRGVLTPEEVQKVFTASWRDNRCRVASLVSVCHGLRAGEVGALCIDDLDSINNIITIKHSWERHERKLKTPKNGRVRIVYTDPSVMKELLSLYRANPHGNRFIFWNTEKEDEPMNLDNFRDSLQEVLVACGIPITQQRVRKIDFHSWRHFANSAIRGHISDAVLQQAMGHSSTEMTDRYYHMTPEQGETYRKSVMENILPLIGHESR
jgi:integrase